MWRVIAIAAVACNPCSDRPSPGAATSTATALGKLWDNDPASLTQIEVAAGDDRITVDRTPGDDRFWCRVAKFTKSDAPREFAFPVEPRTSATLLEQLAKPVIRRDLGEVGGDYVHELGLDSTDELVVHWGDSTRKLRIGKQEGVDLYVMDPETHHAYLIEGRAWSILSGAERLMPIRKLVDRRDLTGVAITIGDKTLSVPFDGKEWTADDNVEDLITKTLKLRPGAFDRTLDPAPLRKVFTMEFQSKTTTQRLELFAEPENAAFHIQSSRAIGLALLHKPHALEVDALAAQL